MRPEGATRCAAGGRLPGMRPPLRLLARRRRPLARHRRPLAVGCVDWHAGVPRMARGGDAPRARFVLFVEPRDVPILLVSYAAASRPAPGAHQPQTAKS